VTLCQVRWIDIDAYRHVNNTVYLRYLEQARLEMIGYLGRGGGPPRSEDAQDTDGFVIAELEVNYRRQLTFRADPVEVHTWVTHLGRTAFGVRHRIVDAAAEYATAVARLVCIDRLSTRPRPIRAFEREYLEQFLDVPAPERA